MAKKRTRGDRSSARLSAKYSPRTCVDCGRVFIPLSGVAKRCWECRYEHKRLSNKNYRIRKRVEKQG